MACGVAVKRFASEFDQLYSGGSPDASTPKRPRTAGAHLSPFGPTFAAASSFQQRTPHSGVVGNSAQPQSQRPFGNVSTSNLSSGQIETYLKAEIRYLKRRKLIPRRQQRTDGAGAVTSYRSVAPASPNHSSSSSDSEGEQPPPSKTAVAVDKAVSSAHRRSDTATGSTVCAADVEDKPLFSLKQVQLICERLLQEQESRLRFEYESILNVKLAEQHEVFVKFTQDQIRQQIESKDDVPSYMS